MTNLTFDPKNIQSDGLAYTALSRISNPDNLYLLSALQHRHIKVDPNVIE